ncbi:MAG TPA: choice-of-anchor P family protein [bacterium]|nr:choice-of-anchor P family protein [bacterium]
MTQSTIRRRISGSIAAVLGLLLWSTPSEAWSTAATTFSGQAVAARVTILSPLSFTAALADTGPLPASGGAREASLLEVSNDGLSADVLHASTVGEGGQTRSEASIADLSLTIGGNTLSASFLSSQAATTCQAQGPAVSGGSQIVDLAINGQLITVAGSPNQTVPLPNGRVVINEQSGGVSGSTAQMTVTAVHVVVDGIADIALAYAHADITCSSTACIPSHEFVTGGGWITGPSGAKATFAVSGGTEPGWGHLVYIEHAQTPVRVRATTITGYENLGGNMRRITGTAEVNGQSGFAFTVDVADNGEPGAGVDTFALQVSNGYNASGTLGGGNIQLHHPCP